MFLKLTKNICNKCHTELKIKQIYGLYGDVSYVLECNCRSYGKGKDYGYFSIHSKMVEWRIPTFNDRFDKFANEMIDKLSFF